MSQRVSTAASIAYQRRYNRENREQVNAGNRARYAKRAQKARAAIFAAKARPCLDCGECYLSCVMDFDHVRGVKVEAVGAMVGVRSLKSIEAEISKCDVVCSNCHRIRTHTRRILAIAEGKVN